METKSTSTDSQRFERKLRNLENAWRRRHQNGRNAESSDRARAWRYSELQALVAGSDEVCDTLDNSPKLAERWNRMERRMAGLESN